MRATHAGSQAAFHAILILGFIRGDCPGSGAHAGCSFVLEQCLLLSLLLETGQGGFTFVLYGTQSWMTGGILTLGRGENSIYYIVCSNKPCSRRFATSSVVSLTATLWVYSWTCWGKGSVHRNVL